MSTTGPLDGLSYGEQPAVVTEGEAKDPGNRTTRFALAVLALVALAAIAFVTVGAFGSDADAKVTLRPLGSSGDDPFSPSIAPPPSATLSDFAESGADRISATGTLAEYRTIGGGVPGVFGGTLDEQTCDVDQLVTFLQAEADKSSAWALALGLDAADISAYAKTLTAANLGADTRVLEHGFTDGGLVPRQALLQRGTAVLVDPLGVPRVDCYSGNPLRNPTIETDETFEGASWPQLSKSAIEVIEPASQEIDEFVLVDVANGNDFKRPAGSTGTADVTTNVAVEETAAEEAAVEETAPQPTAGPPTPAPVTRDLTLAGDVEVNRPIESEIAQEQSELIYRFDAPNGAKLTVNVANDRASVGRIAVDLRSAGASLGFFRVPPGGTESLALTLNHEGGGPYEVIVTEGPGAFEMLIGAEVQDDAGQGRDAGDGFDQALEISSGQLVAGHLAGLDASDAYLLELVDAPALVFTARTDRGSGGRAAFELEHLGETITFLRVNQADEESFRILLGPDDDGVLELLVTEGPAEYEFTVDLISQDDAGREGDAPAELADAFVVESLDEIAGEVGDRDAADYFLFSAPSDEFTLSVDVDARSDSRVAVDVLDPDGTRVDFFRVEPGATGSLTIQGNADDQYRMIFTEGRGSYSVTVDT